MSGIYTRKSHQYWFIRLDFTEHIDEFEVLLITRENTKMNKTVLWWNAMRYVQDPDTFTESLLFTRHCLSWFPSLTVSAPLTCAFLRLERWWFLYISLSSMTISVKIFRRDIAGCWYIGAIWATEKGGLSQKGGGIHFVLNCEIYNIHRRVHKTYTYNLKNN